MNHEGQVQCQESEDGRIHSLSYVSDHRQPSLSTHRNWFQDPPQIPKSAHTHVCYGDSDGKESACTARDLGSIPGLGRSPGGGNGYPFQYSCLENPMDRGTLWAIVHRVSESWTRLSDWACTCTSLCSICLSVYFESSFPSVPSSHHFLKHTILFPPSDSWAVYWASDPLLSSLFLHKSIPIMQVIKHSIKQVSVSVGIPFRCYSTQDAVVTK